MKVLITGGAGFVGSQFVRQVFADAYPALIGAKVTVLDKLAYSGNRVNLDPVAHQPRFRFVLGDVCDPVIVRSVVSGHQLVIHFAAESHVDRSITAAAPFVLTNVVGTQVLLDAALHHRVERFVHVSTDEVYGSIEHGRWSEDTPVAPRSPYSATKAGSDLLALAYHRTHGLPVLVTRCCNNYGPYQFPEKVIPRFITNLLDGRPVPLYGDGGNVREWLHVDDHCAGIALVAAAGRPGEIYHIGSGAALTNRQLTAELLRACGADWDMVAWVPDRKGHDRRYALDHTKISTELGYAPRIRFVDGLAATVRWYRDHRDWWEPLRSIDQRSLGQHAGGPKNAASDSGE